MLQINEIFGPTIQGEGKSLGRPSVFIRLGGHPGKYTPGCNSHCYFCDTAYTWRYTDRFPHRDNKVYSAAVENTLMSVEAVESKVLELTKGTPVNSIVITGGEPLLFQDDLISLCRRFRSVLGFSIEVETAGTIIPKGPLISTISQFNVSPKLENSGNPKELRYRPEAIDALKHSGKAIWKFVVSKTSDFVEIDEIVNEHDLKPVYIMPEGVDVESLQEHTYVEESIRRNYFVTPRMHIQIWGNQRGH